MLRIGINGVGRIGRGIFRVNQMKNAFKVVAINDINPDTNNIAYTLNYDTLYGRLEMPLKVDKNISEEEAIKLALDSDKLKQHLKGKDIKKKIFVPGRLVNIVI